ncbi:MULTISPECIES: GDYXXLXY domain-containing protein [unclassified Azospirillum]|uniref:GDYXXLXY domain-containing protein n=1 Tax=unclassified Azospirillum TaxID=2630922 RepID=UPI000B73974D|nr:MULTISPECIES: GDYXXLXY domain-containing protein [unclassified Azospirillum]SNS60749.1 GDYXXLXY protein [Azospirillum sp. RU38E]SNS80124.1 GDYXXLXY protein [Azospirillum sp. RU37A]
MKAAMSRPALLLLAALLLPTLVLAGWAGLIATRQAGTPSTRVEIQGFDPRDLLRGHYLQARLKLGLSPGDAPACVCVEPENGPPGQPATRPLASCQPLEVGSCRYPMADPLRVLRIYVPQEKAADLDRRLRKGEQKLSVAVHFQGDGEIGISDLQVDGVPVADIKGDE